MPELKIKLIQGNVAPRYTEEKQLEIKQAVITENGMESGFPLIDFQLTDNEGKEYFCMASGQVINTLSAAIKGVNMRNHGVEESDLWIKNNL